MQRLRTVTSLDVSAVAGHHAMPASFYSDLDSLSKKALIPAPQALFCLTMSNRYFRGGNKYQENHETNYGLTWFIKGVMFN